MRPGRSGRRPCQGNYARAGDVPRRATNRGGGRRPQRPSEAGVEAVAVTLGPFNLALEIRKGGGGG